MSIQNEIERFILDDLLSGSRATLDHDEHLFQNGTLDSLATLRLITFLEEKYELQIGDGEVGDENFGSVNRIAAFVVRKQQK
jgi:acyl carrier protein